MSEEGRSGRRTFINPEGAFLIELFIIDNQEDNIPHRFMCLELSHFFFFQLEGSSWCIIKASFAFTSVFLRWAFYSPQTNKKKSPSRMIWGALRPQISFLEAVKGWVTHQSQIAQINLGVFKPLVIFYSVLKSTKTALCETLFSVTFSQPQGRIIRQEIISQQIGVPLLGRAYTRGITQTVSTLKGKIFAVHPGSCAPHCFEHWLKTLCTLDTCKWI